MLRLFRCEVDLDCAYHCDALAGRFPEADEYDLTTRGADGALCGVDAAVISGSTAGVYEDDEHGWIADARTVARRLVGRGVPTLGVCFGHQLVNDALGGRVEHQGVRAGLAGAEFGDDPLFEGVPPVVTAIHGDVVVEAGRGMEPVASVEDYPYPLFATRHREAPVWTVQFHPELTAEHRERLVEDFGWTEGERSFAEVDGDPVFENFRALAGVEPVRGQS
jgi:GMP synthase (glutamine-hydrolysing)